MKRSSRLVLVAVVACLGLAAFSSEAMAKGSKLRVEDDSRYGKMLVSGTGKALYLFTKETGPTADCYGDCATAWPPYLTTGKPVAAKGLDRKRVGTTQRTDGTTQVTYRGHPLYFYVHDTPNLTLCHDVFEFGGRWLLLDPRGKAVR